MVRFLCKPDIAAYMPAAAAHSRCWHMPAVPARVCLDPAADVCDGVGYFGGERRLTERNDMANRIPTRRRVLVGLGATPVALPLLGLSLIHI